MGMVWPRTTPVTAEVAAVTPLWGGNEVCTFYLGRSISSTLLCSSVHRAVTQEMLSGLTHLCSVFPCLFWFPSGSRKSCSQWTEGAWGEWPLNEEVMAEEQCDSFWVIRITQDRLLNTGIEEAYLTSFPPKD